MITSRRSPRQQSVRSHRPHVSEQHQDHDEDGPDDNAQRDLQLACPRDRLLLRLNRVLLIADGVLAGVEQPSLQIANVFE